MRTKSWTEEVRDWGSACTAGRTPGWPWRGSPRAWAPARRARWWVAAGPPCAAGRPGGCRAPAPARPPRGRIAPLPGEGGEGAVTDGERAAHEAAMTDVSELPAAGRKYYLSVFDSVLFAGLSVGTFRVWARKPRWFVHEHAGHPAIGPACRCFGLRREEGKR